MNNPTLNQLRHSHGCRIPSSFTRRCLRRRRLVRTRACHELTQLKIHIARACVSICIYVCVLVVLFTIAFDIHRYTVRSSRLVFLFSACNSVSIHLHLQHSHQSRAQRLDFQGGQARGGAQCQRRRPARRRRRRLSIMRPRRKRPITSTLIAAKRGKCIRANVYRVRSAK